MKLLSEASRAEHNAEAARNSQSRETHAVSDPQWTGRWLGWVVLWAGWLIPQLLLLGPALVGRTVDLPVDLLAAPHINYFPKRPEYANIQLHNADDVSDLVLIGPATGGNFAAKELRAGRVPLWQPANFAGAPLVPGPLPQHARLDRVA
jgi:hypothetical protein